MSGKAREAMLQDRARLPRAGRAARARTAFDDKLVRLDIELRLVLDPEPRHEAELRRLRAG
jgi:hypothetical protein